MFRRRIGSNGQQIIDKPTYQKLTRSFLRRGGVIIRGEEAERHLEKQGAYAAYFAGGGFAFRDHGILASARDASGKQGVDGFVVADLDGFARCGVLGEHEAFSFSRFLRYSRVFLLVMRAGAMQTVCPRFLPLAHLAHSKLRGRKSAL